MQDTKQNYSHEQRNEVIDALRATLEATRHHKSFGNGGRFKADLAKRLGSLGSLYCVSVTDTLIRVWGNGAHYDSGVHLYFNLEIIGHDVVQIPWHEVISRAIDIADSRDTQEREEQEQDNIRAFGELNVRLQEALRTVQAIRKEALEVIGRLSDPRCATVRAGHFIWELPTSRLSKQYPDLFSRISKFD